MDNHKPLACHVCGAERKFLEYGSKIGKDGREAKWPIYETCPNLAQHNAILATAKAEQRAVLAATPGAVKDTKQEGLEKRCKAPHIHTGFLGPLFSQVNNKGQLLGMIDGFEITYGYKPLYVLMNPADIGYLYPDEEEPNCNGVKVLACHNLSYGFKYALLVTKEAENVV